MTTDPGTGNITLACREPVVTMTVSGGPVLLMVIDSPPNCVNATSCVRSEPYGSATVAFVRDSSNFSMTCPDGSTVTGSNNGGVFEGQCDFTLTGDVTIPVTHAP